MTTVEQMMRDWQERRAPVCTARTRATNVAPVATICDEMGEWEPDQLTQPNIERFRNVLLDRGQSKLTVARYLSTLRAGLGEAGEHLKIGKLIAELKREPTKVECWTKTEVATIMSVARDRAMHGDTFELHNFFQFLFSTGCRRGEALALQIEDIDLKRKRIHIHRALTLDGGLQNGTKWGGERWVPLSVSLYRMLHNFTPTNSDGTIKSAGPFFPNLDQRNVGRCFNNIRSAAGVRPFKLHCTRHTAISWALTAGMSLRKASEIFGVSQGTLESHYAHYVEEEVNMEWANL